MSRFWKWAKRHVKWGAVAGVAAALVCHFIPENYRALCSAVAHCLP